MRIWLPRTDDSMFHYDFLSWFHRFDHEKRRFTNGLTLQWIGFFSWRISSLDDFHFSLCGMILQGICQHPTCDMVVSYNRGTPKSSILVGFSLINHLFWGAPISGNTFLNSGYPGTSSSLFSHRIFPWKYCPSSELRGVPPWGAGNLHLRFLDLPILCVGKFTDTCRWWDICEIEPTNISWAVLNVYRHIYMYIYIYHKW